MKLSDISKQLYEIQGVSVPHANNTIVNFQNGQAMYSYDTPIAFKWIETVYLTKHWDYSKTTGKHLRYFLGEGIADTRLKIASGVYKLLEY